MIADCTAIILAGGESRRMGCDKATLQLGEHRLVNHVADALRAVFPTLFLSVRQPRPDIELPQICDQHAAAGPLAGLFAALETSSTPWIFTVATDMPFIKPALIEFLASKRSNYQAVVPRVNGFAQPLAAFYSKSCLLAIGKLLADSGGRRSLRAALEQLNVCYVDESELLAADPELKSFFDLDTPQDLAQASDETGRKGL